MDKSIKKAIASALLAASAAACGTQAPTAVVQTGAIALKAGQEIQIAGSVFHLSFLKVNEDSRCPSNVQCIWAGNGAVELGVRAGEGPTTPHVINTMSTPTRFTANGYEVRLDSLTPYPRQGTEIKPGDYAAYVNVEPKAP